ncbi:MAG TPA: hypothetical protein VFB06_04550 [Streptosporangiaceae bacterium]|nr:hypothetical protein [Streptosporangiaceae bacterium]
MRIFKLVAAAAAAGAMLLTATSAYASGGATGGATGGAMLKASSDTVYQGGKVYLAARCRNDAYSPVLASKLFDGGAFIGTAGHTTFVQVNVSKTKKPRPYAVRLLCVSITKKLVVRVHAWAVVWVTVLKATHKTSPGTIANSGGKPLGVPTVIIETGFGGMAGLVAHHHPMG